MKRIRTTGWIGVFAFAVTILAASTLTSADDSLAEARRRLLAGNYAEAESKYAALAEKQPVAAAVGVARCRTAVGKYDEAAAGLNKSAAEHPKSADLLAELAQIEFLRGKYPQARGHVDAAIRLEASHLAARWIGAELHRVTGKLDEAGAEYKWFVDYYNRQDAIDDAQSLRWIALAAAQYARWNRLNDQFSFLVNELCPDMLAAEKDFWPAHYLAGRLFLEKYNEAQANKELKAALAINPNAAEVHAAIAEMHLQNYNLQEAQAALDRALEINPRLPSAHLYRADVHFSNFEPRKALPELEKALRVNPLSEAGLGRLAAAQGAIDGIAKDPAGTRMGKTIAAATKNNSRAGQFYVDLADALDKLRRWPDATGYYEKATELTPQLPGVRGRLGMIYMRLGEEEKAKKMLGESFDIDPFNVRVNNTLKVLEVLDEYETIETEHFVVRFDPRYDKITARYTARWLETVYPQLARQLGYQLPEKALFELFNKSRNTSGHGWFSARMVGLPQVHTIGACAGKMVAMVSPTALDQKVNWARVLKHELVHVINLQQTNFNIPHWFTEALAVHHEGLPRSEEWNEMLARRVPGGETFNLETINLGFIRPTSSEDWQMAYCQAEMYAQYMLQRFGEKSLAGMLAGYADNLTTRETIRRALGVEQEEFEKGYTEYVAKIVASLSPAGKKPAAGMTFAELEKAHRADPADPDVAAQLAVEYLRRKSGVKARKLADAVLDAHDNHPLATYVKARLYLSIGDTEKAEALLQRALDERDPEENVLNLLAALQLRAQRYDEAESLYRMGSVREPGRLKWTRALAGVYLKSGNDKKLAAALEKLAEHDGDNVTYRKKLAQMALAKKQYPAAARWAGEAIHVDVMDAGLHHMLAEALAGDSKHAAAVEEYETAVELSPRRLEWRMALARACADAGLKEKGRGAVEDLLRLDADYPGAKKLLEKLK